jgi:hypothetical protein
MATTGELIERLRGALARVEPAVLEALDERISQGREVPFGELAQSVRRERRSKMAGARIESGELVSVPLTEDEVFGLTAKYCLSLLASCVESRAQLLNLRGEAFPSVDGPDFSRMLRRPDSTARLGAEMEESRDDITGETAAPLARDIDISEDREVAEELRAIVWTLNSELGEARST